MHIRTLNLDNSIALQKRLSWHSVPSWAEDWGPCVRMACSFGRFRRFERALAAALGCSEDRSPWISFIGSGDFHHVSLALLRRLREPFNLLIIDNHPDWMRGVPFMHCGTWVHHAARLPLLGRIIHAGGDVDFDNYYHWLAPWPLLRSRKITVLPAMRSFTRKGWGSVPNVSLRPALKERVTYERLQALLQPLHDDLKQRPLYVSLDKDVMTAEDATVNWDSGHLILAEVQTVLRAFLEASGGHLTGMDIVGDWSPVRHHGWLRHLMHWTEHPGLVIDPEAATRRNEQANLGLLNCVLRCTDAVKFPRKFAS